MIYAHTRIHVLDLDKELSLDGPVSEICKHYIPLMTQKSSSLVELDFSKGNFKIKDWTGWTQLLKIEMIIDDDMWTMIKCDSTEVINYIKVKRQTIPVYDSNLSKPGFHGEVKYKYTLHDDQYLKGKRDATMRILVDDDDEWQQFIPVHACPCLMVSKIPVAGYEIYTKSGFYNANGFHLCSSDTRIEDGKESWK